MPASARRLAAQPPEAPEPTIRTSNSDWLLLCMRTFRRGDGIRGWRRRATTPCARVSLLMAKKKTGAASGVPRRSVLRGLATGVAGAVAAPGALSAVGPAEAASPMSSPQANPDAESVPASLLPEHDRATFDSLCDLLVPGSVDAAVPDLVDRVAAVETADYRSALLAAIRAFEGEARATHAARWIDLDRAAQVAVLDRAAAGAGSTLHRHLVHLRDLVANAYFATEPGMRRLGWTPRTAWRELPACEHSGDDHH
ncbi:MAG TPA: hypothetical protein DCP38_14880 [Acidobacteria bacterium]|nr:hypothetical protein [Acidobacteriota bacterium]